jgi:hypothetical protein
LSWKRNDLETGMRGLAMVAVIGAIALTGCSRENAAVTSNSGTAATPVSPATPAADSRAERRAERRARRGEGFTPKASISRADYGGRMERRFRKLDRNQDDKLTADELPQARAQRMVRRLDTSGDGAISQDEWSRGMLARFDRRDANNDGTLTPDERGKRGGARGNMRRNARDMDAGDTDMISDNGDAVDEDL